MTRRNVPVLLCLITLAAALVIVGSAQSSEAPAGFGTTVRNNATAADVTSNGFTDNGTFADDFNAFSEPEGIAEGLGPTYNSTRCAECHNSVGVGGVSQITELRVGHNDGAGNFVNPTISLDNSNGANTIPNRSLINDRAICDAVVERVPGTENINALRATTNTLGDGFVEAIDSNTLNAIANAQPGQSGGQIAGQFIQVPVAEAGGAVRGGRFGWKNQQASLLSFSSDAYLNEQGITNRFNPTDVTSVCDTVADPEDQVGADGLTDIDRFARFMRATQVIPRDTVQAATADAQAGAQIFNAIGCNICHVSTFTTVPAGTVINQGQFTVPAALGNKTFHPFSDFLLHDVGTGDGIVQNGGQATANKLRTQPLWGLRFKDRLMHDLLTFTRNNAILRHGGEATGVTNNYRALSNTQKNQLIAFLQSL